MSIFNRNHQMEEESILIDAEEMEQTEEIYEPFSMEPMDTADTEDFVDVANAATVANSGGGGGSRIVSDLFAGEYFMMIVSLILAAILLLTSGLLLYKTHALSTENGKLENRLQRDNKMKKSEAEYETETENLEIETDALINRYGIANTPEKTILFLANLSSTTGVSITSIEFGDTENPVVTGSSQKAESSEETADSDIEKTSKTDTEDSTKASSGEYSLSEYQVMVSYTGTYAELKKAINFIEDYGERITVNDLTATYDETTNLLTGSMTLNMYTLSGTDHKYTPPSVSGSIGTSNIFG